MELSAQQKKGVEINVTEFTEIKVVFGCLGDEESPRQHPCVISNGKAFALQHKAREWRTIGTSNALSNETIRREGVDKSHKFTPALWEYELRGLIPIQYEYDLSKYSIEKGTWYIALGKQICYPLF
jgi:hypothetical protein